MARFLGLFNNFRSKWIMNKDKDRFPSTGGPFLVSTQSRIYSILVILLQLAVIAFIVALTQTGIYLRYPGNISNNLRVGYITGITILATLITAISLGHVRSLWALKVTHRWYFERSAKRRREASTIVGLGSFWDAIRCWPISISFLMTGLMTAAIAAALAPTIVTVTQESLGSLGSKHTHISGVSPCLLRNDTGDWFSWKKSNGWTLSINTTADTGCELQQVRSVAAGIDQEIGTSQSGYDGEKYRYLMRGIPVSNSAIGAPFALSGSGFHATFGINAADVYVSNADYLWIRQCLPILKRNPVVCTSSASSDVKVSGNNITVTTPNCTITSQVFGVNPEIQGATASGACTENYDVGTATIVMGSTNEHARFLAAAMGKNASESGSIPTFAVSCYVDIAPSVTLRYLNYSRADQGDGHGRLYGAAFTVDGDDTRSCEMELHHLYEFLTDTALATGAAASWSLLTERQYNDGWWPTLQSMMIGRYSFDNSQNNLEDALGLLSGIAMGMYWGTTGFYHRTLANGRDEFDSDYGITPLGIFGVNAVRIGPSRAWAVAYIAPSLFSLGLLTVLLIQTWTITITGTDDDDDEHFENPEMVEDVQDIK